MWKQKISMSLESAYTRPTTEVVKILRDLGFDAVAPAWMPRENLDGIVETARALGMELHFLHGPFAGIDKMWSLDDAVARPVYDLMKQALDDCIRLRIPVMVMHTWIGFAYEYDPKTLNFTYFDRIVDHARANGVQIAFENTEGEEYLKALMDHFRDENAVGFCYDSGHEMCYNHSRDMLTPYGNKLLVTHLNDNLGITARDGSISWFDDLHLLPYDGAGDWDDVIARLKNCRKVEYINLECSNISKPDRHENDVYARMSLEDYFMEAYKRARRLAYRYSL